MSAIKRCLLIGQMFIPLAGHASELPPLEPYQVLRSLHIVQDRIADGDQAALPMQGKLLVIADDTFNTFSTEKVAEPRNVKALLKYGLSGGNPKTVLKLLSSIPAENPHHELVAGVSHYVRGRREAASEAFGGIDPFKLDDDIGAFVALAIGSANSAENTGAAIAMLKRAILIAPGTLVEEAALRRLMAMHMQVGDTGKFMKVSERYARRFSGSPYANQFADMFVSGVVNLQNRPEEAAIADVADGLTSAQRSSIYLRIARKAAVEGLADLSAAASSMIRRPDDLKTTAVPPGSAVPESRANANVAELRSRLYDGISTLRESGDTKKLSELKEADSEKLPPEDRKLLTAVMAVANAITEPIRNTDPGAEMPDGGFEVPKSSEIAISPDQQEPETAVLESAESLISEMAEKLDLIDQRIEKETR